MTGYVTDTHALLWHLLKSKRISKDASSVFEDADDGKLQIFVPSIVLVEIVYLTEKVRISKEAINRVIDLLEVSDNYKLVQIGMSTIRKLRGLPRHAIPDMPDRIITATALELDLPLLTKDQKITEAKVVETVW